MDIYIILVLLILFVYGYVGGHIIRDYVKIDNYRELLELENFKKILIFAYFWPYIVWKEKNKK